MSLETLGHVERLHDERIAKGILYEVEVNGWGSQISPRKTWRDYVNQRLESDHIKSQNNRRVCILRYINVK